MNIDEIFCTIPPELNKEPSYLILSLWAGAGPTLEPLTLVPIPALAAAMF